MEELIWNS